MSKHESKIIEGAKPFLEEGEEVLAAFVARPRGWSQRAALGGVGVGGKERAVGEAGEQAGLPVGSPMALALTDRRVLSLGIDTAVGLGAGGDVKELLGALPVGQVDSIKAKRLLLGYVVTVTAGGVPVKLEANAAAGAKRLAAEFERVKAQAGAS